MADEKTTMTLGDFVKEAAAYPHSKEYFELVKESGELTLMAMYLDSYDYMKEAVEFGEEVPSSVCMMFTEAAEGDAEKAEPVVDDAKAGEVKEGFFKRIWDGIVRIFKQILVPFDALRAFFRRLRKKFAVNSTKMVRQFKANAEKAYEGAKEMPGKMKDAALEAKDKVLGNNNENDEKVAAIITEIEEKAPYVHKIIRSGNFTVTEEANECNKYFDATVGKYMNNRGNKKYVKNMFDLVISGDVIVPEFIGNLCEKIDEIEKLFSGLTGEIGKVSTGNAKLSLYVSKFRELTAFIKKKSRGFVPVNSNILASYDGRAAEIKTTCNQSIDLVRSLKGESDKDRSKNFKGANNKYQVFTDLLKELIYFRQEFNSKSGEVTKATEEALTRNMNTVIPYYVKIKGIFPAVPDVA